MLSKKFYDWATIIFVLIMIGGLIIFPLIIKSSMPSSDENSFSGARGMFENMAVLNLVWEISGLIYYIFVLILAIQLTIRKEISVLETIFIAILIPLAFIFYLVSLRRSLSKIEMGS